MSVNSIINQTIHPESYFVNDCSNDCDKTNLAIKFSLEIKKKKIKTQYIINKSNLDQVPQK